jgi:hypothetical protein
MGRIYTKNNFDNFTIPLYRRSGFWQMIAISISLLLSLMISYFKINDIKLIAPVISLVILTLISLMISLYKWIKKIKFHSLKLHNSSVNIEKQITKALINTMKLNTMKQTKKIEVPDITVDLKGIVKNGQAIVSLERLPSMNNVDELIILISNSFRGKYKNFAVVDFVESDDTLSFKFTLEDVNIIKTFIPKSLKDVKTDDCYKIKLQNDLIWQLNKAPHGIISGVTNSGKTTTIYQIILSCFLNGINDIKNDIKDGSLYLVDPKNEFTALNSFYSNIYTEIPAIFNMLEEVNNNLEQRQKYISEQISKTGKLGATAYDFDIRCDIIIIDELTSLISSIPTSKKDEYNQDRFYKLISQIIQRGRSSGVYLIFAGQNFNSDILKIAIRNAPAFRLLLGEGTQEDYKFIFSNNTETIKRGLPARFMGYYTLAGFVNNPQRFYVPNLHKNRLNTLESFRKAYKKGLK